MSGTRALPENKDFSNFTNLAILQYVGAASGNPTPDPTTDIPTSTSPLVEADLHVRPRLCYISCATVLRLFHLGARADSCCKTPLGASLCLGGY